jgi:hypothetical protein
MDETARSAAASISRGCGELLGPFGAHGARAASELARLAETAFAALATTNAPYHDLAHTRLVTRAGLDLVAGRAATEPLGVEDVANPLAACLLHDIGYVRGVAPGDRGRDLVVDAQGTRRTLGAGEGDAVLLPLHVDRSKLAARALLAGARHLDAARVEAAIEATRFPAPAPAAGLDPEARLVRAADLIGQTADPDYFDKAHALFRELSTSAADVGAGYRSAAGLIAGFPEFYRAHVAPVLDGVRPWLEATPGGRRWLAGLETNLERARAS